MFGTKRTSAQPYILPTLEYMISSVEEVRDEYARTGQNDPKRLLQITTLEANIRQIKTLRDSQPFFSTNEDLRELAFAEWLRLYLEIKKEYDESYVPWISPERSGLFRIVCDKLKFNAENKDYFTPASQMYFLNKSYALKFSNQDSKEGFQTALAQANLKVSEENARMIKIMRKVCEPIYKNQNQVLDVIARERALDNFLEEIYNLYMLQADTNNLEHRFLASVLRSAKEANRQEGKDEQHFLSFSHRVKLGIAAFVIDSIRNYKKYKVPFIWGPENSTLHRLAEACFFGNYDHFPQELKHECLCAAEMFFEDLASRKNLENILNNKKLFPKEPPHYINSVLRPIVNNLKSMIDQSVPLHPQFSNITLTAAVAGAIIALMPGAGIGIALGFGAGLTNYAARIKEQCTPLTACAMKCMVGDGGKLFASYGAEVFFNEGLKFTAGATIGAIAAVLGAVGGAGISIALTEVTPDVVKSLISFYHKLLNHPDIKPVLEQKLFTAIDPQILNCMLDSPPEVFPESVKEKIKLLDGDAAAMARLFAHQHALRSDVPKASFGKQVLTLKP